MEIKNIIFDLDDTLIHCNKYFNSAIDSYCLHMVEWFKEYNVTLQQVVEKQKEFDILGVKKKGFAIEHFGESLLETYEYFCNEYNRAARAEEEQWIDKLGKEVYSVDFEPYPHMKTVLDSLKAQGYNLYLYTGGNPDIQHMKIKKVGIEKYFGERVHVAIHKNEHILLEIMEKEALEKKHTCMIGNSMRSDIIPAIKAGIKAIFIQGLHQWDFDKVTVEKEHENAYITLNSLKELEGIFVNKKVV